MAEMLVSLSLFMILRGDFGIFLFLSINVVYRLMFALILKMVTGVTGANGRHVQLLAELGIIQDVENVTVHELKATVNIVHKMVADATKL